MLGFTDDSQRFSVKYTHNNKIKHVKRLDLLFEGENKREFACRLLSALAGRASCINAIRLRHFVDHATELQPKPVHDDWLFKAMRLTVGFQRRSEVQRIRAAAQGFASATWGEVADFYEKATDSVRKIVVQSRSLRSAITFGNMKSGLLLASPGMRKDSLTASSIAILKQFERRWARLLPDLGTQGKQTEEENAEYCKEQMLLFGSEHPVLADCFCEIADEYEGCLREAALRYHIKSNSQHHADLIQRYNDLGLNVFGLVNSPPTNGKVDCPEYEFVSRAEAALNSVWIGQKSTVKTIHFVQSAWDRTVLPEVQKLVDVLNSKEASLADLAAGESDVRSYRHSIKAVLKSIQKQVTDYWPREIVNAVVDRFGQDTSGRGKFNLFYPTWEAYLGSETQRFLLLCESIMQHLLRDFTNQVACEFERFWLSFLQPNRKPLLAVQITAKSTFSDQWNGYQVLPPQYGSSEWFDLVSSGADSHIGEESGKRAQHVGCVPSWSQIEYTVETVLPVICDVVCEVHSIQDRCLALAPTTRTAPQLLKLDIDSGNTDAERAIRLSQRRSREMFERTKSKLFDLMNLYQQYVWILNTDLSSYFSALVDVSQGTKPISAEHLLGEAGRFFLLASEIRQLQSHDIQFNFVLLDATELQSSLIAKCESATQGLLHLTTKEILRCAEAASQKYTAIESRFAQVPKSEEELIELKRFVADTEADRKDLEFESFRLVEALQGMEKFAFKIGKSEFESVYNLLKWPLHLAECERDCFFALEIQKEKMIKLLHKQQKDFDKSVIALEDRIAAFKQEGSMEHLVKLTASAQDIDSAIRNAVAAAADLNRREGLFAFTATDYSSIDDISADFEMFYKLWTSVADFQGQRSTWLAGPFTELDAKQLEADVNDWWQFSGKAARLLEDDFPGAAGVAQQLRDETSEFKKLIPFVRCLASPALKWWHWDDISKIVGVPIELDENLTLQWMLDQNVRDFMGEIEDVSVKAEKEHNLDVQLQQMQAEWQDVVLEVKPHKETGTYIIGGLDEIDQLLDDHLVKTQTMLGSPYVQHIKPKAVAWESALSTIQSTLEEWLKLQRTWMYLEPIFASDDINRQMPAEGRRFSTIDGMYRTVLAETLENPLVISISKKEKLHSSFANANMTMDKITKNLNDYLETKRQAFPRFYFLSNDGLLEILSQTKDPRTVQRHLDKCFEGMAKICFAGQKSGDEDDLNIVDMISIEGETIPLIKQVDPMDPANAGNVELWLSKLEMAMRLTVKNFMITALDDFTTKPRSEWVLLHPAQAVLNIGQLFWTRDAEKLMDNSGNKGLKEFVEVQNSQLRDIVALVRGQLSKLNRVTMGALCVIDVHARDVIESMADKGVERKSEFMWMSQLRYYWEERPDTWKRYGDNPWNLIPRIVNATQMYGYEYLGNSSRLVITPLTDRCYRTLMGAVSLMYGGAPAGPAGTGKTETTKDLAKAMAIQCVVYNCSDQLDVAAMAKFFKGLAASGAWACFDEFNRINLEVLSVVAQQIQCIVDAKRQGAQTFIFEGILLKLNPDANCFITMNPGYAGRTELPDNLKALFRPCAMMVPDYALIAEIKLYSFGFEDARNQARKVTQVLRLASEQLSSQKHYDYGMRAVFSILLRAGQLRQELGAVWSEDKICLRSINDVNLPKFTSNDLPLFKGITQDLFPGVELPVPDYRLLSWAVRQTCASRLLQPKDEFLDSIIQLTETVAVRHGLMVVGETCSGKTQVIHTLAQAMTLVSDHQDFSAVHIHTMNPKAVKQNQLYGRKDPNTMEWYDGMLAVLYRNCATSESPDRQWVLFDGPVDAVWIEDMNTVLDDNKKLCLSSGEIIKMSSKMTMMFETDNLKEASPATVSRVGMVFMEPQRLGWRPQFQSWLNTLPNAIQQSAARQVLEGLAEWLIPPCLHMTQNFCQQLCPVTDLELVSSFTCVLDCMLRTVQHNEADDGPRAVFSHVEKSAGAGDDDEPLFKPPTFPDVVSEVKASDLTKMIDNMFVMAIVWSIGAVVDSKGRIAFDVFLRSLLSGKAQAAAEFVDFLGKNPNYDAHFESSTFSGRNLEGDCRDYDRTALDTALDGLDYQPADFIPKNKQEFSEEELSRCSGRFSSPLVEEGPLRTFSASLPDGGLLYDYKIDLSKGSWMEWMKDVPRYKVPRSATFSSVVVPSLDSIRSEYLVDMLVRNRHHVLCVGDTGTGKSVLLSDMLKNKMPPQMEPILMAFSAQTSANQTQDIIDGKCKKRRKGVFGPPPGQQFVVFVDDLNMPAKETYGAQPPIEILRQWMDHGGWYDRYDKEQSFMQLVDMQFIAAMGPPGGGRTQISQRYVRHFCVLGFVPFASEQLQHIFSTIMQWSSSSFSAGVKGAVSSIVAATIDLYSSIAAELRPTPAKSHYTFNLRDLGKVFQGVHQASADHVANANEYVRLWAHECMRVFCDRLINDEDRQWFQQALSDKIKIHLKLDWNSPAVRGQNPILLYSSFCNMKTRHYGELDDREALDKQMSAFMEDYNVMSSAKLNLVLFDNAIEHICRISRIINLPMGNALLVGVGGSGRKSLTTLATFIAEMDLFQIEISKAYGMTEWRDDLKRVLTCAGASGKETVFLFSDTQIKNESFVEDLNNILNNGEVPNLFESDELAAVLDEVGREAKKAKIKLTTPAETFSLFVQRCKENLHMVLCFSPIGDAFRTRLRMFPSLVNCCTIDWFTAWPEQALRSVAEFSLANADLADGIKKGVIDVCVSMQKKTAELSDKFLQQLGRHYYVTPTSYLELINTFQSLLSKKQTELIEAKARYDNGLTKLAEAESKVDGMKAELEALTPKLKVAQKETAAMLQQIEVASKETNEVKSKVAAEETVAAEQNAKANAIKAECETDLAKAIPILKDAESALKAIDKGDIAIVKKLGKPPAGVKLVMEAVCIMMGLKPQKVKNPDGKGKIDDYWPVATKQLLSRPDFLKMLQEYDSSNIAPDIITKMKESYISNPDFNPEVVKSSSGAAAGLCKWCHALVSYDEVIKVVGPKKQALAEAEAEAAACMALLATKQAELKEVVDKLSVLEDKLKATQDKKQALEDEVNDCSAKLKRAEQLITGLGGEKTRWRAASERLQAASESVVGDIMLSAGVIAYLGAFTASYRHEAVSVWTAALKARDIVCADQFEMRHVLGDEVQIRKWTIDKLPNDSFSIDNAIMMQNSARWPLMIDPQGQANKWIRNSYSGEGSTLRVVKQGQPGSIRTIESAVQFGHVVLLENLPEYVEPVLEPLLSRSVKKVGGALTISLGDNTVEYDPTFKLFMTTTIRNPHFPPELCVKVNLLNFMATSEGLQDQMLGTVVRVLEAKLEAQRESLVLQDAENKMQLKDIEDTILRLLKEAEGDILEDDVLITTLGESKVTSDQIMEQVEIAQRTQQKIAKVRAGYEPVAARASLLFFCIADLGGVDPMYQYSLEWFTALFLKAIDRTEVVPKDSKATAKNLNSTFTLVLFENVCRSLFEQHKLMFSFLLASRILVGEKRLQQSYLQFFLQGSLTLPSDPNPVEGGKGWLSDRAWADLTALKSFPSFSNFLEDEFCPKLESWEEVFNSSTPLDEISRLTFSADVEAAAAMSDSAKTPSAASRAKASAPQPLKDGSFSKYSFFERLMLLRSIRPDKVVPAVQQFIELAIGKQYIDPPPFDLEACFADSSSCVPLVFILSPGADPMAELDKLAAKCGQASTLVKVSLGQGQGPVAEAKVSEAVDRGSWVCLQNCHLAESWLPQLERLCENLDPEVVHEDFRLWLTAMPSPIFPVSVLQNSVKVTIEPAKGLRANLLGSLRGFNDDFLDGCAQPKPFRKLLFGLCFFHAIVRERRKYGPLGWNIPYEFAETDLKISMDQLRIFLDDQDFDEIPYQALAYLVGECNYGGRVTDDKDRRCIINILSDFYTPDILDGKYKFSESGTYYAPAFGMHEKYVEYVRQLPMTDAPEVFGLHPNADITTAIAETNSLLSTTLALQPRTGGAEGSSWESTLAKLAGDTASRLPSLFDIERVRVLYPVKFEESMNTVLVQELIRFNGLLAVVKKSLSEVQRAIKGLVVMSDALEKMGNAIVQGQVPGMWSAAAYPSLKPFASWVSDLVARLNFFNTWIAEGAPRVYWISGFFFTQSFLTGTRQNFARKYVIPIDEITYDFKVLPQAASQPGVDAVEDGALVTGLFLEGASWNDELGQLQESKPRELFVEMPYIHMLPAKEDDIDSTAHVYSCPVYKTSERRGMLSTTGHSTNYLLPVTLPMPEEYNEKHYVKRGVAMLTQLDD